MNIKKDDLVRVSELLSLIPQRSGVPPSDYIRIEKGKKSLICSLSSDVVGKFSLDVDGEWPVESPYFVDRSLFFPFVLAAKDMKLKKDFMFAKTKGDSLLMKHGRRRVVFAKMPPVTGYGKIPTDATGFELTLTDGQKEMVRCAESCATTDPITPHLNCVYVTDKGLVLASNQIVIFSAKTKKFQHSVPMPLYLLKLLDVKGATKLLFSEKYVVLKLDCGDILQSVPQKAIKGFPESKIVSRINESALYKKLFAVNAEKLSMVLERFSSYMFSVRRQDKVVTISMTSGDQTIRVSAKVGQTVMSETLKAVEAPRQDVRAEWALDLVTPVIKFLGTQKKVLTVSSESKKTPFYVDGGDVKLLLARKVSA